jgi:hypothetical protein
MITLWLSLSSHAPCVLVLQCKLELDELFLVPSMIKLALWDHFGMWFEIVDCHTGLRLYQEF